VNHEQTSEQRLRRAERHRAGFFELSLDLLSIFDEEGYFSECNPSWERVLGYGLEELRGKQFIELVHPDDRERTQAEAAAIIDGKRTVHFENRYVRKDGDVRWLAWTAVFDTQDRLYFAVARDVTNRKSMDAMKDEFVSVVSHELRTPLTSIRASIGLLAAGKVGTLTAQGKRMLDIALNNTERLIRLVNDILDLERMGTGKLELTPAWQACHDIINSAFDGVRGAAETASVSLSADIRLERCWCDRDRLVQVLVNLLGNAIKFSPPGSTIRVHVGDLDGHVCVEVIDQGPGIPSAVHDNIFEPFVQADSSDTRNRGGSGLGLAICKQIVELHGGRIWVESLSGQGSRFCFTLPLPLQGRPGDL
jgi:PAS domain S-box-containing protein